VLDGDPAPPTPKGHSPNFRPMSIVAKCPDDQHVTDLPFAINVFPKYFGVFLTQLSHFLLFFLSEVYGFHFLLNFRYGLIYII